MAPNPEASTVRARRKNVADDQPAPPPAAPVTVGANEPARHYPALGDPREPRIQAGTLSADHPFSRPHPLTTGREVAEATGWVQDRADRDDYVIAECDVFERIVPPGCVTPTTRMRWAKGQHVPIEVYRAWEAARETESTR